jgi:hypothetical protein
MSNIGVVWVRSYRLGRYWPRSSAAWSGFGSLCMSVAGLISRLRPTLRLASVPSRTLLLILYGHWTLRPIHQHEATSAA